MSDAWIWQLHRPLLSIPGTTAEEFIIKQGSKKSKKEKFHEVLARVLGLPLENVDIITIMDVGKYTDVRYAAHGSPYYQTSQMDSAVVRNQKKVRGVWVCVCVCVCVCKGACIEPLPSTFSPVKNVLLWRDQLICTKLCFTGSGGVCVGGGGWGGG